MRVMVKIRIERVPRRLISKIFNYEKVGKDYIVQYLPLDIDVNEQDYFDLDEIRYDVFDAVDEYVKHLIVPFTGHKVIVDSISRVRVIAEYPKPELTMSREVMDEIYKEMFESM